MTGFGSESYTYDAYGNLTMNGSTTLTTDTATNRPDYATTGATYDTAGNLTGLGFTPNITTYTYDKFNQLASVQGPQINRSQATTADGERLFVRDGTTYLFTVRDLGGNVVREYEYTAAGGWRWKRDNVYRGGLLLASEARNEGIQHYHLDHLGSPRLVTSRTGEQLRLFATSPFGKDPTATQSSERMRFTVHERDLGSLTDTLDDIDYMHARSYSARLGRFFSIDAMRGRAKAPQSFALYSYVRNSAVGRLDRDGRRPTHPEETRPDGKCDGGRGDPDCSSDALSKEPTIITNEAILNYLKEQYGPIVVGAVINKTGKAAYYKPESDKTAVRVPEAGFPGEQDGVTHPDRPGEVFKTIDGVDVVLLPNGEVDWHVSSSVPLWKRPARVLVQTLRGGWKGVDWLEDLHTQSLPEDGWDALFEVSK